MSPASTTWPWLITTRWSQTRSSSWTAWEENSTVSVAVGDRAHERLLELLPCQRIQTGHRLVQHQQIGPLGQRQRERHLGLLPSGERAGAGVQRNAQLGQAPCGQFVVEAHVARAAEAQQIRHGELAVERVVLGEETDAGQRPHAVGGGRLAEHLDRSHGRREQTDRQTQQGGLAGTVRADECGDTAGRQLQRAVAQGPCPAIALADVPGTQRGLVVMPSPSLSSDGGRWRTGRRLRDRRARRRTHGAARFAGRVVARCRWPGAPQPAVCR